MFSTPKSGLFIAFEGGEGSGKSTQARRLVEALINHGIPSLLTHEPGDTPLGKHLRQLLLNGNAGVLCSKTEALLFAADRAQHVHEVILPALQRGEVVVCDRYIVSSLAYQVYGAGLVYDKILDISEWAANDLKPHMTFLLDIDPMIGLERAGRMDGKDRYEKEELDFHNRVRNGFLSEKKDSWVTLHGNLDEDGLHETIFDHVLHVLHVLENFRPEETKIFTGLGLEPLRTITEPRLNQCPDCGIVLTPMFGSETDFICPNNHGWMEIKDGESVWHPPKELYPTLSGGDFRNAVPEVRNLRLVSGGAPEVRSVNDVGQ